MAIINADGDEIVIRLLYDGPALAGKTTSIKALQQMLAARRRSELFTPGEAEGRTLYFDWMDYLGGWCDGHQVRCQIVSAPGQRSLVERRKLLLRDADAVVFVAESTAEGTDSALESYAELRECLADKDGPPVPVVMQANKQDLPSALGIDELRERFAEERHLAIIGSSASNGVGVREAFTFAVRLALDRVRELTKEGKLRLGEPTIRSGEELLDWIESEEAAGAARSLVQPDPAHLRAADPRQTAQATPVAVQKKASHPDVSSVESVLPPPPEREYAADSDREQKVSVAEAKVGIEGPPALPTSSAPSGLVWRPIEGRIILHELEDSAAQLRREDDGSWVAVAADRWHLRSEAGHAYADLEEGRHRLLEIARLHNTLGRLISERRALTLAETGDGHWRLWKIVRRETALCDRLAQVVAQLNAEGAKQLFGLADELVRADERFREARTPFRATLRGVGECDGRLCFVGIVPDALGAKAPAPPPAASPEVLVRNAFGPSLEKASREGSIDAPGALSRLAGIQEERPERSAVIEALAAMLIGQ